MSQPAGFLCPPPGNAPTDSHLILWGKKNEEITRRALLLYMIHTVCVRVWSNKLQYLGRIVHDKVIEPNYTDRERERERVRVCPPPAPLHTVCVCVCVCVCVQFIYHQCHQHVTRFPKLIKPSPNPALCQTHKHTYCTHTWTHITVRWSAFTCLHFWAGIQHTHTHTHTHTHVIKLSKRKTWLNSS